MQDILNAIGSAILSVGIAFAIVIVVSYIAYMIGLILVLKRLKRLDWRAFVPLLNFYAQVLAINAPKRWFLLALPPYVGAVYAGSVAIRLGQIFNRGPAFSLVWLTIGAPVGMFIIARTKEPLNWALLEEEARLLDVKAIRRHKSNAPLDASVDLPVHKTAK